jgi:crotonobetainyl-CoA:carnitine CoA-transferase CaiB-like acyl-CoA transferase
MATLSGVLAALHERDRTGLGRLVETSLLRAGYYAVSWDASQQLRYGVAATAQPRNDRPLAVSGYFRTADERWFCVIPRSLDCFAALAAAIDRPDLLADPRFAPPIADLEVVRELRALLDGAFLGFTLAEIGQRLTRADLIWAPMASLAEVAADPQAHAAGCFVASRDRFGGEFQAPASPVRFPGLRLASCRAAPALGEHTGEVLAEAGCPDEAIAALIRTGAAFQAS